MILPAGKKPCVLPEQFRPRRTRTLATMHEHLGRIRAGGARLALAALVVLLATAGGIIATIVVPTSVSTDYYTARVALSPSWQDRSAIGVETIVGLSLIHI